MAIVDFALNYDFIDQDGRPRQLQFRRTGGHPDAFKGTGQLIAVVANHLRVDNGHELHLTRDGITLDQIELVIDDWETWAKITDREYNLVAIAQRLRAAGLT